MDKLKYWWRELKNWWAVRLGARNRWLKKELLSAECRIAYLEHDNASLQTAVDRLNPERHRVEEPLRLLRLIEEIIAPLCAGNPALINMYELRSWRDDYMQYKINVQKERPGSEQIPIMPLPFGSPGIQADIKKR